MTPDRLGPLWAQASTAPSRLFKCFPTQGGILVPCIVKPASSSVLPSFVPGSLNRSFSTVMDFLPTFLDLAGVSLEPPEMVQWPDVMSGNTVTRKMFRYKGRHVHALRGKSLRPAFMQKGDDDDEMWAIHSSSEAVGWELFARGALRKGQWKIVHFDKTVGGAGEGDSGWELFNVVNDPGETTNLCGAEPEKFQELLACWDEYVSECGIVWGETAMSPGLDSAEAPMLWEDELELQKAWMGACAGQCP